MHVRTYARTYVCTYVRTYIRTDVRMYVRTHVPYVGTFRTHGVLEKYFGRTPDLSLRVLDLHFAILLPIFIQIGDILRHF